MKPSRHPYPEVPADGADSASGGLAGMARAWDRFWFRRADPLPLGVIRLFTGLVILYVHLIYSLDLMSMVAPDGWLNKAAIDYWRNGVTFVKSPMDWALYSEEVLATGQPVWSVFYHLTDPVWIVAAHVGFLVAMFLFTIGFATRLTAVLTWVGVVSYINRLPVFLYGMDAMMNIIVVYLMIGPSGATMSVDRLIERWWARRKGRELPPPEPSVSANFALRAIQVHFCIIYLTSGLSKLQGAAWWSGTAVWGTMANYSFAPMNWPIYLDFLRFMCQSRIVWEVIMTVGSYGTLALEISLPFLIWRPKLRWFMICGSVMMHTGIGLIMGLTTFSLIMLCMVLAFVPASTHHAFVGVLRRRGLKWREAIRGHNPPAPVPQQPLAAGA
jgi:hypothetical protein